MHVHHSFLINDDEISSSLLLEDVFRLRLQKMSSRRLQDVFIKTNIFALLIRLQKTSWRRLDQDQYTRLGHTSSRHFQDVFKTAWKNVFKTSSRSFQKVFKTSLRYLQDVFKMSSRHLQEVFKTYRQVKLFLLTRFQDVFEIYSKRFWDVLQRRLSIEGFA